MFRDMAEGITKEWGGVYVCSAFQMNKRKSKTIQLWSLWLHSKALVCDHCCRIAERSHLIEGFNMERHRDLISHQAALATRLFSPSSRSWRKLRKKGRGGGGACNFMEF